MFVDIKLYFKNTGDLISLEIYRYYSHWFQRKFFQYGLVGEVYSFGIFCYSSFLRHGVGIEVIPRPVKLYVKKISM